MRIVTNIVKKGCLMGNVSEDSMGHTANIRYTHEDGSTPAILHLGTMGRVVGNRLTKDICGRDTIEIHRHQKRT